MMDLKLAIAPKLNKGSVPDVPVSLL